MIPELLIAGGKGSGFHGHAGRPGKVGGSAQEGPSDSSGIFSPYSLDMAREVVGAVGSYGNVSAKNSTAAFNDHTQLGMGGRHPSQRFRVNRNEVQWDDDPSADDRFTVEDFLAKRGLTSVRHVVLAKRYAAGFNPNQTRNKDGEWTKVGGLPESKGDVSLAHPEILLGDVPVPQDEFGKYLEAHGREWKAAPLPAHIHRGTPKECFKNASLLILERPDLSYVEGIAYTKSIGPAMGFLHAWAVDKLGNVIDPTWEGPEDARYFGVKYDGKKYLAHIVKTGMYGIFGGRSKNAWAVLKKGGL